MSRLGFIARHPKRALAAGATVALAAGAIGGSGAFFSASGSNANNQITAGTLSFTTAGNDNKSATPIFQVQGLYPGTTTQSRYATITNTGNVPANFSLSAKDIVDNQGDGLMNAVHLRVVDLCKAASDPGACQPGGADNGLGTNSQTRVDRGTGLLSSVNDVPLGRFEPGESRTYEFDITLPDTGTDQSALMGDSGSVSFQWNAVSVTPPNATATPDLYGGINP